ncbi:MAG: peptide chain release factor 1 [Flavobacteriales bacterium]|nr:peptide chain release factor 1 [Flavobacteriales bacterium]|tara:strand:+ start:2617 stop:3690 length:1074 start_codon:yes stop_codon:yes gene_type:complete
MIDKLEAIKVRFDEVSKLIVDPNIISDMKKYIKLNKEYKDLDIIVSVYNNYKNIISNIDSAKKILNEENDIELKEMAKSEIDLYLTKKQEIEQEIKILLIPKDPNDDRNAVVEIVAGTGGDEASIFCGDLYRMYTKFIESKKWNLELVDYTEGTSGGFKSIVFNVMGVGAYGFLKYEGGVHRVQRVPKTETQGRVHTSASAVIVLPEAEEFDVELKDSEIKKETYCSSGPGGQSVNTTYSAVRLTHLPTGIVAQCQDQKSQIKNYAQALKVLRTRIYEMELKKKQDEEGDLRKTMVSSGDRSDKIRTYNYPQGRVTDHRIGLTLYSLGEIIDGDINKIIEELKIADNSEKLKQGKNE